MEGVAGCRRASIAGHRLNAENVAVAELNSDHRVSKALAVLVCDSVNFCARVVDAFARQARMASAVLDP